MPHYILELLIALAQMPDDQAFVSIYESGSTDSTGEARYPPPASKNEDVRPWRAVNLLQSCTLQCEIEQSAKVDGLLSAVQWLKVLSDILDSINIKHRITTGN